MEPILETLDIDASAAAVWTVLADYARDPEWRADVSEMRPEPAGPAVDGTVTHEVMKVGGRTYRNTGLVERVDPGRRLEWRTTAGADAHGSRTVEPLGDHRCRVTMDLHVVPHGVNRVLAPVLRPILVKGLRRDLQALATLVAAPATATA
jgi:uncharacterized protein YndB with AHSA1/START domain